MEKLISFEGRLWKMWTKSKDLLSRSLNRYQVVLPDEYQESIGWLKSYYIEMVSLTNPEETVQFVDRPHQFFRTWKNKSGDMKLIKKAFQTDPIHLNDRSFKIDVYGIKSPTVAVESTPQPEPPTVIN